MKKWCHKPTDTYTLDLSFDDPVVSSETFNTLLEENKTIVPTTCLTSEEPKIQDNINNTETSGTVEDKTSPVIGDNSMMLLYLLAGVSSIGMIVVLGKRRKTV